MSNRNITDQLIRSFDARVRKIIREEVTKWRISASASGGATISPTSGGVVQHNHDSSAHTHLTDGDGHTQYLRKDIADAISDTLIATGPDAWARQKNNLAATSNPTTGDDSGDGYSIGSIWINLTADTVYVCTDATVGAAVWWTGGSGGAVATDEDGVSVVVAASLLSFRHGLDATTPGGTAVRVAVDESELNHALLGGVSANQHHYQAHVLADTSGLGADHSTSGLTAGQVLRASGAAAAAFAALNYTDLAGTAVVTEANVSGKTERAINIRIKSPATGVTTYIELPRAGTWKRWRVVAPASTTITFDLWQDTYAHFPPDIVDTITASDKPKLTAQTKNESSASPPTGWITTIAAGDWLVVNIDSVTGSPDWVVLSLRYLPT